MATNAFAETEPNNHYNQYQQYQYEQPNNYYALDSYWLSLFVGLKVIGMIFAIYWCYSDLFIQIMVMLINHSN